jgi:hypothetical protein
MVSAACIRSWPPEPVVRPTMAAPFHAGSISSEVAMTPLGGNIHCIIRQVPATR